MLDNIYFSIDHYIIPFNIRQEGLSDLLGPLEQGLEKVALLFDQLNRSVSSHHYRRSELHSESHISTVISKNVGHQLSFMIRNLKQKKDSIKNFFISLGQKRNTRGRHPRGLMNIGGNVLNYAFGVATETQLDREQTRITNLEGLFSQVSSKINIHQQVLNATISHLLSLADQQSNLESSVEMIKTHLESLITVSEIKFKEINAILMITSAINYINSGLLELYLTFEDFKLGIKGLQDGNLDSSIVAKNDMLEILHVIIEKNLCKAVVFASTWLI